MAVNYQEPKALLAVPGVRLAATAAGIRYSGRDDLLLIELAPGSTVAGTYTQNAFCAAPVTLARQNMPGARAWLVNSGNANAGTGELGLQNAQSCCELASQAMGIASDQVMPFSTGVIGEQLPVEQFVKAMPNLVAGLAAENWLAAAHAIKTTDTVAKGASRTFEVAGEILTISGIAKGAGMIRPDMATMLGFIATDAQVAQPLLQQALSAAVNETFNAVTIDGDTSTNDACVLAATAASGVELGAQEMPLLQQALNEVCIELAQALVRDGEGATKFVAIEVAGAQNIAEARDVAYTVAHSPLVKTALFASDANWGRILAAVGRAPVSALDVNLIDIHLGDVEIVTQGGVNPNYREAQGAAVMAQAEIDIRIRLGRGDAKATVWTSDLSHDYVSINADYRS